MFERVLIANRGEIACRVIRTCRRLGISPVAVYSDADADAQHVRLADQAFHLGGPRPADSYLRGDALLNAARRAGAQAIHPGYGFVSEDADFAQACEAAGIVFIGPNAASMRKMGSKAGAKQLMAEHGVPVVPGYTDADQDPSRLQREADAIGYPLMIKAAHGGGGKGMRIVRTAEDFAGALASCQREAQNAFGRDRVLLERYIETPRHIEFQIFGDHHGRLIHLNERECSAQRRYQKIFEESPSPFLNDARRAAMGAAAVKAGRALDYVNAGTVEFIVGADGEFWFMEINTRLQVEHPVTEMTTGLDLVEWQLRIAAGERLPLDQESVPQRGHAIEVRLYAEDPDQGFLPASGRLSGLELPPESAHVRVDSGVIAGDTVSIYYDPMIAKLIVWDHDRARALGRLRSALAETEIVGLKNNIDFLQRLIAHPSIVEASIDTSYLDRHLDQVLSAEPPSLRALVAAATVALLHDEAEAHAAAARIRDPHSPWSPTDGFRLDGVAERRLYFEHRGERIELAARGYGGDYAITYDAQTVQVRGARIDAPELNLSWLSARFDDQAQRWRIYAQAERVRVHDGTQRELLLRVPALALARSGAAAGDALHAPMPGRIVALKVKVGDDVLAGAELMVMEAMKMELTLKAPRDGRVAEGRAAEGAFVEADSVLVRLEAHS